jgi:hypothetical protein
MLGPGLNLLFFNTRLSPHGQVLLGIREWTCVLEMLCVSCLEVICRSFFDQALRLVRMGMLDRRMFMGSWMGRPFNRERSRNGLPWYELFYEIRKC